MTERVVISQRCNPTDAKVMCTGRWLATNKGDFWFDAERGGYCHKEMIRKQTPAPDAEEKWRRVYFNLQDHTGEPFVLERCPFCSIPLPEPILDKG